MSIKNEVNYIIKHYFSDDKNCIHYLGESKKLKHVSNIIKSLKSHEHPDGYARLENEFIIFEHFEFDSSDHTAKAGSIQRLEMVEKEKLFSRKVASLGNKEPISYHNSINAQYSITNYKDNFKSTFKKHYNEIPKYKGDLIKEGLLSVGENVSTLFFVEDTTIFGNYYEINDYKQPVKPVILAMCDFFIELFDNCLDVDSVICASNTLDGKHDIWYIDHENITEYKQEKIITDDISIISFSPQITAVSVPIDL